MKATLTHRVRTGVTGEGLRFAAVGMAATGAQLALYAFLDGSAGPQLANVLAWLVSTLVANAAHRRYTFQLTGRACERDHLVGLVSSLAALGLSSLALALLNEPTGLDGVVALVAVNGAVGAVRFLALRWWWLGRGLRRPAAGAGVGVAVGARHAAVMARA
ncbi:MAG TPA: GtrA family protein [Nakamurella sp.]|nr:GtrA family protein [Nakamurella sp.]